VGTTAARTLESFESPDEMLAAGAKETRLLITARLPVSGTSMRC